MNGIKQFGRLTIFVAEPLGFMGPSEGSTGFAPCQFRVLQFPAYGSKGVGSHAGAAGVAHFLAEIRSADFYGPAHFI